jgi:hypothetical protein
MVSDIVTEKVYAPLVQLAVATVSVPVYTPATDVAGMGIVIEGPDIVAPDTLLKPKVNAGALKLMLYSVGDPVDAVIGRSAPVADIDTVGWVPSVIAGTGFTDTVYMAEALQPLVVPVTV